MANDGSITLYLYNDNVFIYAVCQLAKHVTSTGRITKIGIQGMELNTSLYSGPVTVEANGLCYIFIISYYVFIQQYQFQLQFSLFANKGAHT